MAEHMTFIKPFKGVKGPEVKGRFDGTDQNKLLASYGGWIEVASWSLGSAVNIDGQSGTSDGQHWPAPLTVTTRTSQGTTAALKTLLMKEAFNLEMHVYQLGEPKGGGAGIDKKQELIKILTVKFTDAVLASVMAAAAEGSAEPVDTYQIYGKFIEVSYGSGGKVGKYPAV